MADIFMREDVLSLLKGKHILLIGDSNIRGLYKDLVWLYKINSLIGLGFLKRRLENSFLGDKLIERSELTRGRNFTEHRLFEDKETKIEFVFLTRCYNDKLVKLIEDIKGGVRHCPDVILMNSCLWDVSRWGPNGVNDFKLNMDKLMKLLHASLPKNVLFIWATSLPVAGVVSGGLLVQQIKFMEAFLPIHVIEANTFTAGLVSSYGYDVLDFHHYMSYQIIRRSADGVHFLPPAVRFLTNLTLTHIALSWDVKLPGNLKSFLSPLSSQIEKAIEDSTGNEVKQTFKKIELLAGSLNKANSGDPELAKQTREDNKGAKTLAKRRKKPKKKYAVKTPPRYHKALRNNASYWHNDRIYQNYYSSNNSMNYQADDYEVEDLPQYSYNQLSSYVEYNHFQSPIRDLRFTCFNDFNQASSSSNNDSAISSLSSNSSIRSNYAHNYYQGNNDSYHQQVAIAQRLINVSNALINTKMLIRDSLNTLHNRRNQYEDRFCNYQTHPYRSEARWNGGWHAPNRKVYYQQNIGPIRHSRRNSGYFPRQQRY